MTPTPPYALPYPDRATLRARVAGDVTLYRNLVRVLLVLGGVGLLLGFGELLAEAARNTYFARSISRGVPYWFATVLVLAGAGLASGGALFARTLERVETTGYRERLVRHLGGGAVLAAALLCALTGLLREVGVGAFMLLAGSSFLVPRYAAAGRLAAGYLRELEAKG